MRKLIDSRSLDDARRYSFQALLRRQHGVIHRAQARAAGLTSNQIDNEVRRGRWHRCLPCVYSTSTTLSGMARIWATMLWAGPRSVIAGRASLTAAALVTACPLTIAVYVASVRSHADPPGIDSIRTPVPDRAWRWHRGLRITSPARTVLDLARWGDPEPPVPLVLQRGAATVEQLNAALSDMTTLRGYSLALAATHRAMDNPWSPPEQDLHDALRRACVTGWSANSRITVSGRTVRPDIAFDRIMLAVEVEGRKYHSEAVNPDAFEKDARRRQVLENAGWFVLRFTATQIQRDLPGVIRTITRKIDQLSTLYGLLPAEFADRGVTCPS